MSGGAEPRRYVSTLRIQLSPLSGPRAGAPKGRGNGAQHADGATALGSKDVTAAPGNPGHPHNEGLAPPLFVKPLHDCFVDEGNDITLKGVITGSRPIRVSWSQNGEVVRFGKSSVVGEEVRLFIGECLPEDAGEYVCVAENAAGTTSSSSTVCVRDFETIIASRSKPPSPRSPLPPHPTSPHLNRVLSNGGPHSPWPPQEDLAVFRGPRSPQSPQTGSLQPGAPQTGSPGDQKKAPLKRRGSSGTAPPLQFLDPPDQLEVQVGQTARLACVFKGSAPVVSCWIYNKSEVLEDSRCCIESSDEESSLIISDARPEDSGSYTIAVRDRKSSAQHTLTLSVIELPHPPASCPVVSVLSPSSLVLSWSGPTYDGGSVITGYVVEVQPQGPEQPGAWSELVGHCKSTSLRVSSGLRPQQRYRFRVRARNAAGKSEPSEESQAIGMDTSDGPREKTQEEYVTVTIDSTHKVTDHYNVLEKLGAGKFGQVFRLVHKETGRVRAGKFYKGRRAKEREAAKNEIELMNVLHHPKLAQCLAAYDGKPQIVMVMEYIAGGELFERITDDSFEYTEPTSAGYVQQILQGLQFMHQQSIVHLDLKPENVVCTDRTGTQIKLIDFGLASKLDPLVPLKVMHGTPEFVAPEVISYEPVSLATDLWSVGVITYILLSGESPFQGESDTETLALVTASRWEFEEESFEEITEQAKDFISSLLNKDIRRRMLCEEALAHPWMVAFISADPATRKSLPKDKMKKFLARRKWKKTGKALQALKRMALLSKPEGPASPSSPPDETGLAMRSLELKLQSEPVFSQALSDQIVPQGADAQLSCHITGYPDPEVEWLKDGEEMEEQPGRVEVEYEDGFCTLLLQRVTVQNAGLYTCRATNDHGEALCSATLNVLDT